MNKPTRAPGQSSASRVLPLLLQELARPWKLTSLAAGIGLLIYGSFYYQAPDWDVPISLIMALVAYATASWSMHVMVERQWTNWPLMLFATWFAVDGCYWVYWSLKDPVALDLMRSANAPASLCLYWMCGLVWYPRGTAKELYGFAKTEFQRLGKREL